MGVVPLRGGSLFLFAVCIKIALKQGGLWMQELFGNLWNLQWQQVVMWGIGGLLIWLAIKKEIGRASCRERV